MPLPASLGSGDILDDKAPTNAPNITPDRETGLGRWTDQEIVLAIREGRGRDGRPLSEHPANSYSVMTEIDAAAIVSSLRSLRPIRRQLARSAPQRQHETVHAVPPAQPGSLLTPIERGAYLVQLGECVGCHTPAKADGNPVRELTFAGGRRFRVEKGAGSDMSSFDPTFSSAATAAAPTKVRWPPCSSSLRSGFGWSLHCGFTLIQTLGRRRSKIPGRL